jgi:hypothetical protein
MQNVKLITKKFADTEYLTKESAIDFLNETFSYDGSSKTFTFSKNGGKPVKNILNVWIDNTNIQAKVYDTDYTFTESTFTIVGDIDGGTTISVSFVVGSGVIGDTGYVPENETVLNALGDSSGQLMYKGVLVNSGGADNGVSAVTKSGIAANGEIVMPKAYDPTYSSRVVSVQEFIATGITDVEEVARVYSNTSADSFAANQYVSIVNGFGLITSAAVTMNEISALGDGTLYSATIDLTEYLDLGVL